MYGVAVEPRVLLDRFEAELPDLAPGWEGKTIGLVAHFQIGMGLDNPGMAREAIRVAIEDSTSLTLIAGDFVYQPDSARVREAVALVRPLAEARILTVAVLGNHGEPSGYARNVIVATRGNWVERGEWLR